VRSYPAKIILKLTHVRHEYSYHTPSVGFGCWSLTMLFYGSIQLLLIMLWLVSMLVWNRGADGRVIHDAAVTKKAGTWGGHIWYAGFAFSVCVSVFHSVGGTSKPPSP
jgi:uncharacterized membrane protein YkvI